MTVKHKRLAIILGSAVVLALVGLCSNALSRPASERAVLKEIVREPRSVWATPFRFSDKDADAGFVAGRLGEIGESSQIVSAREYQGSPFPNVRISPAVTVAPFVQRVRFWSGTSPLGGCGGRAYAVSLFGLTVHVWTITEVVA